MEKATLEALGWSLGRNDTLTSSKVASIHGKSFAQTASIVTIRRRFQFSSTLKRQSSVATVLHTVEGRRIRGTFVAVKGAPETLRKMIISVPHDYEDTFKHYTRMGSRVLALGYKYLST